MLLRVLLDVFYPYSPNPADHVCRRVCALSCRNCLSDFKRLNCRIFPAVRVGITADVLRVLCV
jgi:hypothetical protein